MQLICHYSIVRNDSLEAASNYIGSKSKHKLFETYIKCGLKRPDSHQLFYQFTIVIISVMESTSKTMRIGPDDGTPFPKIPNMMMGHETQPRPQVNLYINP